MYQIFAKKPECEAEKMILLLPGRGQSALDMLSRYVNFTSGLDDILLIAVDPIEEWYPAPNGSNDQEQACWGLKISVPQLENFICELENNFNISRENIAIAGFSAGAVMAIQVATQTTRPYAAVVSHNGAILEPHLLPKSSNKTPFLLIHSKDDDCFYWEERYLPMKNAFQSQEYVTETHEVECGGHYIHPNDVELAANWILNKFKMA
jgi:predicted esterase